MANTTYIQFFLTNVDVGIAGDLAVVTCEENILTSVTDPDGELSRSATVVATNLFRRRPEGWRLWAHHGSPVIAPEGEE
jgi:ketosteroid isomerase-like protein